MSQLLTLNQTTLFEDRLIPSHPVIATKRILKSLALVFASATRPDISFAMSKLNQFISNQRTIIGIPLRGVAWNSRCCSVLPLRHTRSLC
jgi:hypothetical protein